MRIGTRLWIHVVAVSFAVLLLATTLRLRDEHEMLEQSTIEDRRFFAEALAAALGPARSRRPNRCAKPSRAACARMESSCCKR